MLKSIVSALFVLIYCIISKNATGQDSMSKVDKLISFPDQLFKSLDKKSKSFEQKIDRQTNRYLVSIHKQEAKLRKRLYNKDSTLAKQLFEGMDSKYAQLKNTSGNIGKYSQVYSSHLDSLTTALSFLKGDKLLSSSNNQDLEETLSDYKALQNKLNASDQIKKYLNQRKVLLKEQLEKLGMVNELKQFEKQVYYYQAQIKEYKQSFEDPTKLEEILLSMAKRLPQFKEFFAKNSLIGSLFSSSGNASDLASTEVTGLQTRASVNQSLIDRFGGGSATGQMLQQNMQSTQGQLNDLKNKVNSFSSGTYSNGNNSDASLLDFKPNSQKTKNFLQRLELGTNFQSQKGRNYFPQITDLGLSIGYKLNDKSVIGIGFSGKIGWGFGWNNVKLTYEGIGLRSYLDYKIKGSFFISGGYEQNYFKQFHSIGQLKKYNDWTNSGLIGLSKRYKVGKKIKGEMKLLWDFLSYGQMPMTQPIVFRIGYSLK